MKHLTTLALASLLTLPCHAITCDSLKSDVEAKIRAGGVKEFTLTVVAADAAASGKVVGTCELGKKKLVYTTPSPGAAQPAPAAAASAAKTAGKPAVVTECKDGSVSTSGVCKK